jgi:hypothetical protein
MSRDDVPRHEFMLLVMRSTIAVSLVWAVGGAFAYSKIAKLAGWDRLSVEANFSIFIALTLACIAVVAALGYIAYLVIAPRGGRRARH